MEYSEPKQIKGTEFYTQTIWDEKNKKGYIAVVVKMPNGKFKIVKPSFAK